MNAARMAKWVPVGLAAAGIAGGIWRLAPHVVPRPFGTTSLFVVHLLAAVPFAVGVLARLSGRANRVLLGCAAGVSAVVAVSFLEALPGSTATVSPILRGALGRCVVAGLGITGLVLVLGGVRPVPGPTLRVRGPGLAAGLALLVLAPLPYTLAARDALVRDAAEQLGRQRVGEASRTLAALEALDPGRRVEGQLVGRLAQAVARQAAALEARLGQEELAPLDRAGALAQLGRYHEAEAVLTAMPAAPVEGLLLLAAARQAAGHWAASSTAYARVLEEATPAIAAPEGAGRLRPAQAVEAARRAYEGTIQNALRQGDLAAAEGAARQALDALPAYRSLFLYRLGRVLEDQGRAREAAAALDAAGPSLSAGLQAEAAQHRNRLRMESTSCLLWPFPRRETSAAAVRSDRDFTLR